MMLCSREYRRPSWPWMPLMPRSRWMCGSLRTSGSVWFPCKHPAFHILLLRGLHYQGKNIRFLHWTEKWSKLFLHMDLHAASGCELLLESGVYQTISDVTRPCWSRLSFFHKDWGGRNHKVLFQSLSLRSCQEGGRDGEDHGWVMHGSYTRVVHQTGDTC